MTGMLLVHVVAGSLGLVSGFVALHAAKGAPLHRRAGRVFVASMLVMATFGFVLAVLHGTWAVINMSAAIMSAYLVITALTAVRPPSAATRRVELVALLVALPLGLTMLAFGIEAIARGGNREGIPFFPFFLFGLIGLFGGIGDLRRMRAPVPAGTVRIARHLWRMSMALFIAAMSFFLGQADEFPKSIRNPALLALPPLSVLVTLLYWVWRIRIRRALRGLIVLRAPEAAPDPVRNP